ncbi:hypothetical protein ACJMK2_009495 [Sinanodonta woodiana]|uniref:Novel STAND NTPase 3 domain-containing protein n=1 Tax=Sinanodonta woodiana TaxID=1069815 RepID=A0ABD3VES4_SINWO
MRKKEQPKRYTASPKQRSHSDISQGIREESEERNDERNCPSQDEPGTEGHTNRFKRTSSCPLTLFKFKSCQSVQVIHNEREILDRMGSDQSLSAVGHMYNISTANSKRNNIAVRSSYIITDARLKDMFVEREGIQLAKQILSDNSIVIIIGESGDGRKWMSYKLMKERMKTLHECSPFILYDISDWDDCIDMNENFVVCLEDVFGKDALDTDMVRKWDLYFRSIVLCAEKKKGVILTLRKTVYYQMVAVDSNIQTLERCVIDLSCIKHQLSNRTMVKILSKYLSKADTIQWIKKNYSIVQCRSVNSQVPTEISESNVLNKLVEECVDLATSVGFPKQAKHFVATGSTHSKGLSFFCDPSHEGVREIQRMIVSHDPFDVRRAFTLLAVFVNDSGMNLEEMLRMLGTMVLSTDKSFEEKKDRDTTSQLSLPLMNLLLEFADKRRFRGSMLEYLELGIASLEGSYIKKNKFNFYIFSGTKVRAEVMIAFLRENPFILIQHMKDEDFCRFVRPVSPLNGPAYEFDMSDKFIRTIVFQRLTSVCLSGCVKQVVEHAVLRKRVFADAFVQYVFREGQIDHILKTKDHESEDGILETSVQYEFIGPKSDSSVNLADKILFRLALYPRESTQKDRMNTWFKEILEKLFLRCCRLNVSNTCDILLQKWDVFETQILAKGLKFAVTNKNDSVVMLLLNAPGIKKIPSKDKDKILRLMLFHRSQGSDRNYNVQGCLEGFIRIGANINYNPLGEMPLLHEFISMDNLDLFRLVLNNEININCVDSDGRNPLYLAVEEEKSEFVRELLSKNIDLEYMGPDGLKAIHLASREGRADIVTQIIKCNGAMADARDKNFRVPLHYAKNVIVAESLIHYGANVNAKDVDGNTPFHWAAKTGNVDLLEFLYQNGGDWASENNESRIPLFLASDNGRDLAVKWFLKLYRTSDAREKKHLFPYITMAARKGNYHLVEALLKARALAASVDAIAAEKGDTQLLDLLLKYNIGLGSPDAEGNTSLHIAVEKGDLSMIQKLYKHGVVMDAISRKEELPIHVALRLGRLEIFQFLYNLTKEPQSSLPYGDTTLHMACRLGRVEFVKYILETNIDILNRQNDIGKSPLHVAVENGHPTIVSTLVSAGSDIHLKDKDSKTPLDLARKKSRNPLSHGEEESYQTICDLLSSK